MNVNEILDIMEDMLDGAMTIPLSGGKCVVDVERMRELIGDVRLNLPQELKQSKLIVEDRKIIIEDAKKEADNIVRVSEERARRMLDEHEITKQAKTQAQEIMANAQIQSKELKRAANEFSENLLKSAEKGLVESVNQIKTAKAALRSPGNKK